MKLPLRLALPVLMAVPALAWGQPDLQDPCKADAAGRVDFEACVADAPRGSPQRALALMNLATQALLKQDFATAVRLYDEAEPANGEKIYSDASFHAFRASAYEHVGRREKALEEARTSLEMLRGRRFPGMPRVPAANDPEDFLPFILPVLKRGGDPAFPEALAWYRTLPAKDWISHANRASVLSDLDDVPGALEAQALALKAQPDHPMVLNTGCVLLVKARRADEALAYCERAVKVAPETGAVHDSHADALAALGRCGEAQAALATARGLDPASVHYRRTLACAAK